MIQAPAPSYVICASAGVPPVPKPFIPTTLGIAPPPEFFGLQFHTMTTIMKVEAEMSMNVTGTTPEP